MFISPVFSSRWLPSIAMLLLGLSAPAPDAAPPVDPRLYASLVWRNIGPFRAGRVTAVSAPVGQPGVYYMGLPQGGVWKSTNAGVTWFPIFDSIKSVSSIGSLEVAPSDPNVIYVGTGATVEGDGITGVARRPESAARVADALGRSPDAPTCSQCAPVAALPRILPVSRWWPARNRAKAAC